MAPPKKPATAPADLDQTPAAGGSYTRHPDSGELTRVEGPDIDAGPDGAALPAATTETAAVVAIVNQE